MNTTNNLIFEAAHYLAEKKGFDPIWTTYSNFLKGQLSKEEIIEELQLQFELFLIPQLDIFTAKEKELLKFLGFKIKSVPFDILALDLEESDYDLYFQGEEIEKLYFNNDNTIEFLLKGEDDFLFGKILEFKGNKITIQIP